MLPIYDTSDAVPEDQREDYAEHEGKWRPKIEVELAVEKRKRGVLLNEKKEAERLRQAAEAERDELKRIKEATDEGVTKQQLDKIRDDLNTAKVVPLETENATLKSKLQKVMKTDRLRALGVKHGVMADRLDDFMDLIDRRVGLDETDELTALNAKGELTAEAINDFVSTTFKQEKPWLYQGSGASGSGSQGSSSTEHTPPVVRTDQQVAEKRQQVAGAF